MSSSSRGRRLPAARSRGAIAALLVVAAAGTSVAATAGHGDPRQIVDLNPGSAWFADRRTGDVIVVDGATASVITRVRKVGAPSDDLEVIQHGEDALVTNHAVGTVSALSMATGTSAPPVSFVRRGAGDISVVASDDVAFMLFSQPPALRAIDPTTAAPVGAAVPVDRPLHSALIDRHGRLWALDDDGHIVTASPRCTICRCLGRGRHRPHRARRHSGGGDDRRASGHRRARRRARAHRRHRLRGAVEGCPYGRRLRRPPMAPRRRAVDRSSHRRRRHHGHLLSTRRTERSLLDSNGGVRRSRRAPWPRVRPRPHNGQRRGRRSHARRTRRDRSPRSDHAGSRGGTAPAPRLHLVPEHHDRRGRRDQRSLRGPVDQAWPARRS